MKSKSLIILFCIILTSVVPAVSIYIVVKARNNNIKIIKQNIVTQQFANIIGTGVAGTRDCYPKDSNTTSCDSLTFEVSKEVCLESEKSFLAQSQKSDETECGPTYGTISVHDKTIKYYFGTGSSQTNYWVQVWVE